MKELFAAEKDGRETNTTQAVNLVATVNKTFKFSYSKVLIFEIKTILRRDWQEDGNPMCFCPGLKSLGKSFTDILWLVHQSKIKN